jgi:hypothetical protein
VSLDDQLRRSLRREPPPAGFADRVAARLAHETQASSRESRGLTVRPPARAFAARGIGFAIAASLIVALTGGWIYERHQARVEAEHAAEQVEMALRITGQTLSGVQEKLAALNERRRQRDAQVAGGPGSTRSSQGRGREQ